jgi:hypothetical protein
MPECGMGRQSANLEPGWLPRGRQVDRLPGSQISIIAR